MILNALYELYDRLKDDPDYEIAPPGYSPQKIAFKVVLRPNGELFEIQDTRVTAGNKLSPRHVQVPGGTKSSGSGINPCFLWDNTSYMLGYKPDDDKPDRTRRSFEAFRKRHLELEEEIGCAEFSAVCQFLRNWTPEHSADHEILQEMTSGFGAFQILGEPGWVHEVESVRSWWSENQDGDGDAPLGQCLITGETASIAMTHPKVKGVSGAQSSGASLVSFNKKSYESYGHTQSENAPISNDAAFRYTTALNALTDGPRRDKQLVSLGDATVVFWTDRPSHTEDVFASFVSGGSAAEEKVQDEGMRQKLELFLRAIREGREAYGTFGDDPQATSFFLLALSPNAARLSVRLFLTGTLGHLLDNIRRHCLDISIAGRPATGKRKGDHEIPPICLLLAQTARESKEIPPVAQTARESKEIPPVLSGPLLRAVVTGARYPGGLYAAVLRRMQLDQTINHPRAAVIKGYLVRNMKQEVSMSLDRERKDPAYRLGRLFAALEKTQRDAHEGRLKTTIRDRFYSSASASPGSVFPRLLRTYQHHLAKLEGGLKVNREKLVQEIVEPLEEFPAHLGLAEQGMFAIGYYHQDLDLWTKKEKTPADQG